MKIAVTGASGSLGKEVLRVLQDNHIETIALTRSEIKDAGNDNNLLWKTTDYSVESLTEIFKGVEAVIHLAAVRGTEGIISDYYVNEILTEKILIAMGNAGVNRIVFASTIAVYSETESIPWKETDYLTPKTLYGISKAACEHLCRYYSKKYGFTYKILRIAQVISLDEKRRGIMNAFVDAARAGAELKVMGKSVARRQFIYSKDVAAALCKLAELEDNKSDVINIGMNRAYTNYELAEIVNEVFGNDTPIQYDQSYPETIEPSEMLSDKIINAYGITPMSLEETLRDIKTVVCQ